MRAKDAWLLAWLGAALAALLAPALFHPTLMLGNFGDIYAFHYPLRHLVASRLESGQMPFWNPYIFSGMPLLADSQSGVFYPLSLLFYFFPLVYAFTLFTSLHFALAALGMHLLLRREGLDAGMSGALAAAFSLSPFLVYRIPQGIPTHLAALSYVPWCWLALRAARPGLLAATWSLQFLSGHPQFTAINAGAMALYALANPKRLGVFVGAGALAALLCLAQLLPTAELMGESNRLGWPAFFASAYSLPWGALATLLHPGAAGTPLDHSFASLPSVFFESYSNYVGLVPLGLAAYGSWFSFKSARWSWLLAVLGLFFALGANNPLHSVVDKLPLVSLSRVPARFSLLIVWGVLMAAAQGAKALRDGRGLGPACRAAVFFWVLADVGLWSARFVYAQEPGARLAASPVLVRHLAGNPVRFATDPELANPDKAMLYRAMNVNGYAAYYLKRYMLYAYRSEKGPAADPSRTYIRGVNSAEMRRLGTAYYLTSQSLPGRVELAGDGVKLYPNPGAFPLAYACLARSCGAPWWRDDRFHAVYWQTETPERWSMSGNISAADEYLVLEVPRYPGWRAWLNGRRAATLERDGLTQAIALPAPAKAAWRAYFIFRPTFWTAACLACAAAWFGLLAWVPRSLSA